MKNQFVDTPPVLLNKCNIVTDYCYVNDGLLSDGEKKTNT